MFSVISAANAVPNIDIELGITEVIFHMVSGISVNFL
jgi:hypothetical protein